MRKRIKLPSTEIFWGPISRLPGGAAFGSPIGRRILGAFSLIRTAIVVISIVNFFLFQYLDNAEVQEQNKLAEQGKLDHLSFVIATQIQAYESAVWDTGKLPSTISAARDLYSSEATDDLLALRTLDPDLTAPGGALNGFVLDYLQLENLCHSFTPVLEAGGDRAPLQAAWRANQDLFDKTPLILDAYRQQVSTDLTALHTGKNQAKQQSVLISTLIGVLAFALALLLTVLLTRQIVPPLARLKAALLHVAAGDLSPRAVVHGRDEISDLLATFNSAVTQLRDLLAAVEAQARTITAEAQRLHEQTTSGGTISQETRLLEEVYRTVDQFELAATALAEQAAQALADVPVLVRTRAGEISARRNPLPGAGAPDDADSPLPTSPTVADDFRVLAANARQAAAQLRTAVAEAQTSREDIGASAASLRQAADALRQVTELFRLEG